MNKRKWIVEQRTNVTAFDTFNEETHQGPTCVTENVSVFGTEEEALKFFYEKKAMLKWFGSPGMYYTYPRQEGEQGEES